MYEHGPVAGGPVAVTAPRRWRRRGGVALGLATIALAATAQPSLANDTVDMAVANNAYPALRDSRMTSYLETQYGLNTLTSNSAGQAGGYWNSGDSTHLRGITSGNLSQQLLHGAPYTPSCTSCLGGPIDIDAFFSADFGNVDKVIASPDGSCNTGTSTCSGIAATETPVLTGSLAIYSCSSTYATDGTDPGSPGSPVGAVNGSGNGVPASARCEATPITTPPTTVSGGGNSVVTWLGASTSNVLSIADAASAPFGAASKQALISAGFAYNDSSGHTLSSGLTPVQTAWPASTCDSLNVSHPGDCKIRLEAGISQVRGAVTSGSAPLGLAALSNLKHISWTSGTKNGTTTDDPNPWTVVNDSEYSVYGPISQWGVQTTSATMPAHMNSLVTSFPTPTESSYLSDYGY
ncbi:MAG TPA: hypothetical protein VHZ75_11270 [Solirubrobacteraceae bacterium]|nr:hypothetical protein [Solirubrobacteraceae bacterium]